LNTRLYIIKNDVFDTTSQHVNHQLQQLGLQTTAKVYVCFDVFHINEQELEQAIHSIFADPVTETCLTNLPQHKNFLAVEYLPGQFDIRADSAMQCCQLLFGLDNIKVQTALVYGFDQLQKDDLTLIKKHFINAVDSREKNLELLTIEESESIKEVEVFENFIHFSIAELETFLKEKSLSIDIEDLKCIQQYFIQENRNPTETEIKVLDTYWSDHCRHTTFLTELNNIQFVGDYKEELEQTFNKYLSIKKELGKENTAISLMDIATIIPKYFIKKNLLPLYHHSKENNAATIKIDVDVNGINEDWLLLFKNETHNHPTEIEPFGGAATCIGGAIRDPLSGRAFVYQAMRVSGAANPLEKIQDTLENKLPQQKIVKEAALGYSSYGNQIGLSTSLISEFYDDGYKAKRFECGFVIAAVKKEFVKEEDPVEGDVVLLLGGDTGRDGIGGASGSSKQHNEKSISTLQAEVQKGNAITERNIQKLFRKPEVIQLIKKCNDFGAGGVCVAIGEIAEYIDIDLNQVPLKYQGLNGTEIAISESQERMAVVLSKENVEVFIHEALKENVKATPIATVTNSGALRMFWNGKKIVDLKRNFLHTNGATKNADAIVACSKPFSSNNSFTKDCLLETLQELNIAAQKGMVEHFDSTVLGNTYLMPFGGTYQLTPTDVSAHFISEPTYTTSTLSLAAWGYHPKFTTANPYLGAVYAIIESVSKLVAAGANFKNIFLSFQEYFERLGNDATKWGKPLATLLGALETQHQLGIAAIGGKDSMSGSFKDLHVPPTFVSFAVASEKAEQIISTELKSTNSFIYLFTIKKDEKQIPDWQALKNSWDRIHQLIKDKKIIAAKHVKDGGIATTIAQMSFGNKIGVEISTTENLLELQLGSIVFETTQQLDDSFILLGNTNNTSTLTFNQVEIGIEEAIEKWTSTFEPLFPTKTNREEIYIPNVQTSSTTIKNIGFGKPNILLPVFPGTNCEFETAHAFRKGNIKTLNFNNYNKQVIEESINQFSNQILQSQILVFSGGFSAGDEPNGSAKYIVNVLQNEKIKNSIDEFLQKGGLILGICNGFQALVKSGLLPYGKVCNLNSTSPTLTHNEIGRHVSQMVQIKVVNDNSPWLQNMKDKIYSVPVSHGEGRFYAIDKTIQQLIKQHQVATQYINEQGNATNIFPFNPNGSSLAIEGIISEDGKIFGRMAHPERVKTNRLKNIPNLEYQDIFNNGINYFL
jgi:phosphoribosylformylglycinamidine synthase